MARPNQLFLAPADDPDGPHGKKQVRNPERGYAPLPPEGEWVDNTTYWHAQIRDGAVVETAPPAPAAA